MLLRTRLPTRTRPILLGVGATALALGVSAGCGAGAAGDAAAPDDLTAGGALGEPQCLEVPTHGTPLVVDWNSSQRTDLEVAMKDGLAVVSYDCKSLKLLPDCRIPGGYGFMGIQQKEEVIQLDNADEIQANLPAFGASLSGQLSRGSALDLALIMVGKRRTVVSEAKPGDLVGSGCAGATHFVRGAYVGAFSMQTGTRGEVRTAAEVFGLGGKLHSSSSKKVSRRDGQPSACKGASPDASQPPDSCGSALRVELRAIGTGKQKGRSLDVETGSCPTGLVLHAGKCTQPGQGLASICSIEKPEDCRAQCERGNMTSCSLLGIMHHYAWRVPKDLKRAAQLYQKACSAGVQHGCSGYGVLLKYGIGGVKRDTKRAFELQEKACAQGEPRGCNNAAVELVRGAVVERDEKRGIQLYERACNGGFASACGNLGFYLTKGGPGLRRDLDRAHEVLVPACRAGGVQACGNLALLFRDGLGVPQDLGKAVELWRRGCETEDSATSGNQCQQLGLAYLEGRGIEKSLELGLQFLEKGCTLGSENACASFSHTYRNGEHVPADHLRANAIAERACNAGVTSGCSMLGNSYQTARGVGKDEQRAAELYKKACDQDYAAACGNLGILYGNGRGVVRDRKRAVALYERGCRLGSGQTCYNLASAYDSGRGVPESDPRALEIHRDACERLKYNESCYSTASLLRKGVGVTHDPKAAVAILEKLCTSTKDGEACVEAGELYARGAGVPKSDIEATSLFRRGCDYGFPTGCRRLADAYRRGAGVPAEPAKVDEASERGCRFNERFKCPKGWGSTFCETSRTRYRKMAHRMCRPEWTAGVCAKPSALCDHYAGSHQTGRAPFTKNERKGQKLFEASCDAGRVVSCSRAAQAYLNGRGAPKSKRRAKKWFSKACKLKDTSACKQAEAL